MKKLLSLIMCSLMFVGGVLAQTMSDDQVVDYIKEAMAQGKSQRQIATELASRGVTREQATRIQQQFGGGKQSGMTES
jgi:SOS response regulatory protein OraA/RecX